MKASILVVIRGAALLFLALALTACGSTSSSLCSRALECDYIDEDDEAECTSDLERALENGDLDEEDVSACLDCAEVNTCGTDILVDCAGACAAVTPYIIGSRFH